VLTRFELFVIVRNQLADRSIVRRSLAIEAVMEDLAAEVAPADREIWGLAGLGANIDARLGAQVGAEKRGVLARDLLLAEGVPAAAADAARDRFGGDVDAMTAIAAALVAAEAIVTMVIDDLTVEIGGDERGERGAALDEPATLDAIDPATIAHRIRRAAERRGDPAATRVIACATRIGTTIDRAAEIALASMLRVREDLRL
jgi:hypothetical protein